VAPTMVSGRVGHGAVASSACSVLLLHLLLSGQLLVGGRGETSLTEGQEHLRWSRHRHDDGMVPGSKTSVNFLNVTQALGSLALTVWTARVSIGRLSVALRSLLLRPSGCPLR